MEIREKKSFWALIVTQFFGAFNDNLLKVLVTLLIVDVITEPLQRNSLVNLSAAVFVAPFLIFSMIAGRLSDRVGKSKVIFWVQIWQIVVVSVATLSVISRHIPWSMASLFLLSMQAAFFSPAKYGILPELMGEAELSHGNGILNTATFVAILAGTMAGSFLFSHPAVACGLLVAGSVGGFLGSLFIEHVPPANTGEAWAWNPITDLWANWKIIRQDLILKRGLIAVNYFWFLGALLQINIFLYAKEMMNATEQISGVLLMSVIVGIALGSLFAGWWSRGGISLKLVPLGAIGMGIFAVDLLWAYPSLPRTLFDMFMLGVSGGFYEIPLNAMIQWRSPTGERARVLATQNFISFTAILWASAALWFMGSVLRFNPAQELFVVGVLSLAGIGILVIVSKDARAFFVSSLSLRKTA